MSKWRGRLLTLEALFFLSLIAFLRRTVPMRVWSRVLGAPQKPEVTSGGEGERVGNDVHVPLVNDPERIVSRAIRRANWRMSETFTCLEQASAGLLMLRRREQPGTVVIGLAKPEKSKGDPWEAHAWLETASGIIIGGEGRDTFKPVTLFGRGG